MAWKIKNSAGKWEEFESQTLHNSLAQAGADQVVIEKIIDAIVSAPELRSTEDIFELTYAYLKFFNRSVAARYRLKQALGELGPHPQVFVQYVAKIFAEQEYTVREAHTLKGRCVDHETQLIIEKNDRRYIIQCTLKKRGTTTDITSVLQLKALFDDLSAQWAEAEQPHLVSDGALLVTNSRFTSQAIEFGTCVGLQLLGWDYPGTDNLADMIHSLGLYPITCLTGLTKTQKIILVQKNILLCRELRSRRNLLRKIQVPQEHRKRVLNECKELSIPGHMRE